MDPCRRACVHWRGCAPSGSGGVTSGARACHEQSLRIFEERRDGSAAAEVRVSLAVVYLAQQEYERAGQLLAASLAWFRNANDKWGQSLALQKLAAVARNRGHLPEAEA